MQLSVIILNYNVRWFLQQCLISVQKALDGIESEIIVVDNNSADDSCAMVKQHFPTVTLIENKENTGFPKGNNIGVAAAKGKYICILNPDTVLAEDTFAKLLAFAASEPNPGIIGVKMLDGTGNFLPESKRGVPTPWVAITKIGGFYKILPNVSLFNKYYAQHLRESQTGRVDILSGACMFMERELYLKAGGFDEGCFMYSDDIDLSYTILKMGRANFYFSGTSIIHYKGESTVRDGLYIQRFREAMQFFYKKHFRSSPVFDGFMKLGAAFFALAKKNKKIEVKEPEYYILFSKNEELCRTLEGVMQKKVVRIAQYEHNVIPSRDKGAEIILDNELLPFGEIIAIMERNKKCVTFKIRPAGCNFIIGSNSSNDRGQVVSW